MRQLVVSGFREEEPRLSVVRSREKIAFEQLSGLLIHRENTRTTGLVPFSVVRDVLRVIGVHNEDTDESEAFTRQSSAQPNTNAHLVLTSTAKSIIHYLYILFL
jgi:hypothetical protein